MVGRNWFGGSHSHNKCTSVSVCQSSRLVDEIQTSFQFESLSDRRRIKPGNSEVFNGLCEFRYSQTEEFALPVDQVCLVFGSDKNALSIFFSFLSTIIIILLFNPFVTIFQRLLQKGIFLSK